MSTRVRVPVGRCWIEVEAANVKEAVKGVSEFAEVFGESQCGLCQSERVRPQHRVAKGFDFYQMVCLDCGAQLDFGQKREDEALFAKRRDANGYELGARGWYHWEK